MTRTNIAIAALLLVGCENPHPATDVTQRFADAILYGDRAQMFASHIDSTEQSEWCRREFKSLLAKAQQGVQPQDCERVRAVGSDDLDAMPDELRLAVQVSAWSCENPTGSCVDYSRTVFDQAIVEHALVRAKPSAITVRKVFGDESTAAAYVDVTADGAIQHLTLEVKHVGEGWRVSRGFLNP